MTKYSINLSEEYRALKKINDVRNYFQHRDYDNCYKEQIIQLNDLESKIMDKILEAIRIYGSAMLKDPNTEFGL